MIIKPQVRIVTIIAGFLATCVMVSSTSLSARSDPNPPFTFSNLENDLPEECRSALVRRMALISLHEDDPIRENNKALANRCGAAMVRAYERAVEQSRTQATVRARGDNIGPVEGLINFETPHVHPLDLTPDGSKLLAVNTAAHKLEVFQVSGTGLNLIATIPVGLDPVSVRARSNSEAWVVNHISDSVSIVDLDALRVVDTILTDNEPADVVFAGSQQRAYVSASEVNRVLIYNPDSRALIQRLTLQGEDPRALAVSNNGLRVYAAIYESGNNTGLSGQNVIIRGAGQIDNDVAIINTDTNGVTYRRALMNMNMALSVNPSTGLVHVVGTEAMNHILDEPVLNGIFLRVNMASFTGPGLLGASIVDLNSHLTYTSPTVSAGLREISVADPRGIAWKPDGQTAFVTGMGSNNVIVINQQGGRIAQFDVGQGPTGVVLNSTGNLGYVMNKFDGSISVIDTNARSEIRKVAFYDPTPAVVRNGRPVLYDAHLTSGTGHLACASCHVDGRTDRLGWQLSNASLPFRQVPRASNFLPGNVIGEWTLNGIKDVMVTQTLIDIMEHPRFHWRGDRETIDEFNGTFVALMGRPTQLSQAQMDNFKAFLRTTWLPPNPYRDINNKRRRTVTLPDGSTATSTRIDSGLTEALRGGGNTNNCLICHSGQGNATRNFGANDEIGSFVVAPALPALYDKVGMSFGRSAFGFFHTGEADLFRATRTREFLAEIYGLEGPEGPLVGDEIRQAPHAGMGQQVTVRSDSAASVFARADQLISIANASNWAELVAHVKVGGVQRGFALRSGELFDADISGETIDKNALFNLARNGDPVTFTVVAAGMKTRVGLDDDLDGELNNDGTTNQCGAPSYDPAVDRAMLVWQDCDGLFHVVAAGGNADASYTGRIAATNAFSDVTQISIESSDTVTNSPANRIGFDLSMGGIWTDEIRFRVADGDNACMQISNQSSGTQILVGSGRQAVSGAFNPANGQACSMPDDGFQCGSPSVDSASDNGLYLWKSCSGSWNVELVGANLGGTFSAIGEIEGNDFSSVVGVSLESSDTLTSSAGLLKYGMTTSSPWSDGFRFETTDDNSLCVAPLSLSNGLSIFVGADRTQVNTGIKFNPVTLGICGEIQDCEAPAFDAATERALFSWIDCEGKLHLLGTGASIGASYDGHVYADSDFAGVSGNSMESSDVLQQVSGTHAYFEMSMGGAWYDEVVITPTAGASMCIDLDAQSSGTQILAGSQRTVVTPPFNPETLASCTPPGDGTGGNCGDPNVDSSLNEGVFVWQSCDGIWHLLVTGAPDFDLAKYGGNVTSSGTITDVTGVSTEASDVVDTSVAGTVSFVLQTSTPWSDEFTFRADPNDNLCVTLDIQPGTVNRWLGPDRTFVPMQFDPRTGGACQ